MRKSSFSSRGFTGEEAAMLGEGFLRVLKYREERKFAEGNSRIRGTERDSGDKGHGGRAFSTTTGGQKEPPGTGLTPETPIPHRNPSGLLIPGHPAHISPDSVPVDSSFDCSLLNLYPDLQVADSGPLPAPKPTTPQPLVSPPIGVPTHPDSVPDQGYLVMGSSVNISVDVPEPRTNSMLNGMLERKLDEVYLQHLTENLARCNSNLENSLLRGLVPPPKPNGQGPDSLGVGVEERSTSRDKTSYLNTSSGVSWSSKFNSSMLRISKN